MVLLKQSLIIMVAIWSHTMRFIYELFDWRWVCLLNIIFGISAHKYWFLLIVHIVMVLSSVLTIIMHYHLMTTYASSYSQYLPSICTIYDSFTRLMPSLLIIGMRILNHLIYTIGCSYGIHGIPSRRVHCINSDIMSTILIIHILIMLMQWRISLIRLLISSTQLLRGCFSWSLRRIATVIHCYYCWVWYW